MKTKFFLLTFLLLFARGCDFYSTSLWFFDNPSGETNPLASIFGFGWTGLIVANSIIVGLILYCFYYYTFKYSTSKAPTKSTTLTEFISELYFNEKGKFYQVFYKIPNDKKILIGHNGYVLTRVVIITSFLATFHNLCQFYNLSFYNTFREFVVRPLFVYYGIFLLSFAFFSFRLWHKEYRNAKANLISINPTQSHL